MSNATVRLPALKHVATSRRFSAESAGAAVLGLIVCAGVMTAAGEFSSITGVAISVGGTVLIYWFAEAYAHALASHVVGRQGFVPKMRHMLALRWPMVEASFEPLVAMLIASAFGATAAAALTVGLIVATALLFLYGWVAVTRDGIRGWRRLGAAAAIAALGVVMIVLKSTLHSSTH